MADDLLNRLRRAVDQLPGGLREHVLRVEEEASGFAALHNVDHVKTRIAALGHDLARAEDPAQLPLLAMRYGIDPDAVERDSPILLHGPVAARILELEYGVSDPEVLAAAAYHTTARPAMSSLEKVIFLADKIEEEKLSRRPEWRLVRQLADTDLDAALLRFLDLHIKAALRQGWQIHPRTIAARNELLRPI